MMSRLVLHSWPEREEKKENIQTLMSLFWGRHFCYTTAAEEAAIATALPWVSEETNFEAFVSPVSRTYTQIDDDWKALCSRTWPRTEHQPFLSYIAGFFQFLFPKNHFKTLLPIQYFSSVLKWDHRDWNAIQKHGIWLWVIIYDKHETAKNVL